MRILYLLPLAVASATQLFTNHGTTSGWSKSHIEHNGTISQVTKPVKSGRTALKMTQTYDPSYTGLYHAEVHAYNGYSHGDERAYGFWFRLPKDWEFTPGQTFNIAQFIANFPGMCDEWMPSTMIWISERTLWTRRKTGALCPSTAQKTTNINTQRNVTAGVWHQVVVQARWTPDDSGFLRVWYDGERVVNEEGVPTTVAEDRPFQFRVGLYANSWNKGYKGNQPFRQVWFDEIAFGTELEDAHLD
ncbi:polysaccharide lyase [Immersiella caudata]|uniref:Polysaccharide lyase n=1 Tax=Immersiella caudata TaxID=314043 RepID=A0AA39X4X6_9PEZI|nr:polysaccharide lyase [Immersiella caudata]